jgi:hypothetical protein
MNSHARPRGSSHDKASQLGFNAPDGQRRTTGRTSNQELHLFLLPLCAPPLVTIKGRGGEQLQGLDLR